MAPMKRPASAMSEGGDEGETKTKVGKAKVLVAKKSGPMPPVCLEELFQFLQCQLRMEAREVLKEEVQVEDKAANEMWDAYKTFVTPNLGANERWVPYHTAFGVHEFFLIESVHHANVKLWDEKRRFLAIFVFRAHCKRDFFNEAQLPHLLQEKFWKNPVEAFKNDGPLEKSMLDYRRKTGKPLLTLCFRMIPERTLKDNDANLVRSILVRTQRLLKVAEDIWPVLKDSRKNATQKFTQISSIVQSAPWLGETWAKMLTVCMDIAYPQFGLLASQCDVGVGAQAPLRCLLPNGGDKNPVTALKDLGKMLNSSSGKSSQAFWKLLPKVEESVRRKFKNLPLLHKQMTTKNKNMSAVTLQVSAVSELHRATTVWPGVR
ncbi:unnamed protein product [Polarella glacialis]|uniref:Uncharacterized protein n=1 Tax=Polarella glacialis TaxID=89957 RepID=A0A813HII4_POLGL|nr:unnamed protein product [Polarella glacialis]